MLFACLCVGGLFFGQFGVRDLQGQDDGEVAAFPLLALQRERAAHQLGEQPRDGEAEAEAFRLLSRGKAGEVAEDAFLFRLGYARTGIADEDSQHRTTVVVVLQVNGKEDAAFGSELDGVREEVADDLADADGVALIDAFGLLRSEVHLQLELQTFPFGYREEAVVYLADEGREAERDFVDIHLSGRKPLEVEQVIDQRKDMLRRAVHILQIVLLPLVGMPAHQQFDVAHDGRERGADVVADGEHQLFAAVEQILYVPFRLLQLRAVVPTARDVADDDEEEDDSDEDREDGDAGNQPRGVVHQLLPFLHPVEGKRHLFFFYIAENLVDAAGNDRIVVAKARGPLEQLFRQLLMLEGDRILQALQDADDGVRGIVVDGERIRYDMSRLVHHDAGVCFLSRESIGKAAEETPFALGKDDSILLHLDPFADDNPVLGQSGRWRDCLLWQERIPKQGRGLQERVRVKGNIRDRIPYRCRILDGDGTFDVAVVELAGVQFREGLQQEPRVPTLVVEQRFDGVNLEYLGRIGEEHPEGIHVLLCPPQSPVEIAEITLGAEELPQSLAFVEKGKGAGNEVNLLPCLGVGFLVVGHLSHDGVDISHRPDGNQDEQEIAPYDFPRDMSAFLRHAPSLYLSGSANKHLTMPRNSAWSSGSISGSRYAT